MSVIKDYSHASRVCTLLMRPQIARLSEARVTLGARIRPFAQVYRPSVSAHCARLTKASVAHCARVHPFAHMNGTRVRTQLCTATEHTIALGAFVCLCIGGARSARAC